MRTRIKSRKYPNEVFGEPEDFPKRLGQVFHARLVWRPGNCTYCFPHGFENQNSKWSNMQKNWKRYRKTQYRPLTEPI